MKDAKNWMLVIVVYPCTQNSNISNLIHVISELLCVVLFIAMAWLAHFEPRAQFQMTNLGFLHLKIGSVTTAQLLTLKYIPVATQTNWIQPLILFRDYTDHNKFDTCLASHAHFTTRLPNTYNVQLPARLLLTLICLREHENEIWSTSGFVPMCVLLHLFFITLNCVCVWWFFVLLLSSALIPVHNN